MKLSVIIPTLNEAGHIGKLVTFMLQHGGHRLAEVTVVDGGSTDETVRLARDAGARVLLSGIKSRAHQMNLGAAYALGDVFYFVHADVKPVPSFVADIFSSIESGHPAGCYRFRFDSDHRLLRFNAYCTRFNGMMCRGGDQTLYITRHLFEELGGYNEYFTIMEDFDFIRRIRKNHAFRIIPKSITVSARKYKDNSWLRVQLANLTVFTMYLLKRSPQDMATTYKRFLHYR